MAANGCLKMNLLLVVLSEQYCKKQAVPYLYHWHPTQCTSSSQTLFLTCSTLSHIMWQISDSFHCIHQYETLKFLFIQPLYIHDFFKPKGNGRFYLLKQLKCLYIVERQHIFTSNVTMTVCCCALTRNSIIL